MGAAILGLCLALLPGSQAGSPVAPGDAAPRIAVEPARFHFGAVLPHKTLRKDFLVRNFGAAPLQIEGLSSSCGCTVALPESRAVAPGGRTVLRVSMDTRDDKGHVRRSVLIRSNDPRTPVLELIVEAEVRPDAGRTAKPLSD
jgi:hypothetical protein